jgi:hypothetical protein
VRTFVRLVALVLVALLAVMFLGPLAPEGSFFNDLADGFARALRIRWVGPFA